MLISKNVDNDVSEDSPVAVHHVSVRAAITTKNTKHENKTDQLNTNGTVVVCK